jgi:hypothetical protein
MNTKAAYRKISKYTNNDQIRNLGKYVDKVKYKWFNKAQVCHKYEIVIDGLPP